ncbi:MAG: Two component transcriptional regulator, winged helix family [Parcubacteria group bacterium GW2011_GWA2_45_30]|nr:MAG: Two component transcriptional regulator, winged helix family [Parcubacteria group bacterium GW2011_GWA2_45_30]
MAEANKNVFLIDDDPFILDMYTLKFKEHGFGVDSARNGKEALEKLKTLKPDCILLDIVMPEMDGFEVLRELKKGKKGGLPKVILLTNLDQKEDVEKGMEFGADDYVIKAHFTPSKVVEKVKQVLQI